MLKYAFAEVPPLGELDDTNLPSTLALSRLVDDGRALYPYKAMKISFETSPNKFSFLLCLQ